MESGALISIGSFFLESVFFVSDARTIAWLCKYGGKSESSTPDLIGDRQKGYDRYDR